MAWTVEGHRVSIHVIIECSEIKVREVTPTLPKEYKHVHTTHTVWRAQSVPDSESNNSIQSHGSFSCRAICY